ncbi:MAG: hypothetical protein H6719_31640 [Sandaracinaceae bacterium]|nr:hypothetical protein [Sandaracinaceae bacterium]
MQTRQEVDERARALYGAPLGAASGVLHVVAVARVGAALRVMRIGERSPKSATDWFCLQLTRARVDAIVVSGSVLRAEPELRYDLDGAGFHALREGRDPPWLCVLTQSGALPASHPVWSSWARPIVYTGREAPLELPSRVEVVRVDDPTPRGALRHFLDDRGCASVSVEAGPRVAVPLYDRPCAIDELLLSTFEGELDPLAIGGPFLSEAAIEAALVPSGAATAVEEPSGPWTFRRYLSRARRGTAAGSR